MEEWEKIGNQLKPSHLRNLIKSLSDSNKFSKALEASSGLCEKEVVNLFFCDRSFSRRYNEKVLGLKEADKFFERSIQIRSRATPTLHS